MPTTLVVGLVAGSQIFNIDLKKCKICKKIKKIWIICVGMMTLQMTNLYMTFEVAHDPFPTASTSSTCLTYVCLEDLAILVPLILKLMSQKCPPSS